MDWVSFHQPGGPLAFRYPSDWTLRTESVLELISPSGSVLRWAAYRSTEDLGDQVRVEPEGEGTWRLSRKRVLVRAFYDATPIADDSERDTVEAILQSTEPDPGLPAAAIAFVGDVVERAKVALSDTTITSDGMTVRVGGQTALDLTAAYRDVMVHPQGRDARIQQVISMLSSAPDAPATWDSARTMVFPLLVPVEEGEARFTSDWSSALSVAYAIDQGPIMRRVTVPHLADWGIEGTELHEAAIQNLQRTTTFRARSRPDLPLTVVGGHTFATAELLLPRFREALVPRLGETFRVAVPSRDVVGAARVEDEADLQAFARWVFAADAFPCSPRLFTSRRNGPLD